MRWDALSVTDSGPHRLRCRPPHCPEFLDRITVNHLRHELSSYEAELAALFGKTGRAEATAVIRKRVYRAIADAYPELAAECGRQLTRRTAML